MKTNKIKIKSFFAPIAAFLIAVVCLTLCLTVFNVDSDGETIKFAAADGTAESIQAVGAAYGGNGYYLSSFYDEGEERIYKVRKVGEAGKTEFETQLVHAQTEDGKDGGVFRTVVGVTADRVVAFTNNWYYLYALEDNGLTFLDAYCADLNIGADLGVKNYTFDVSESGNIIIYNLETRGSSTTAKVYIEKTVIENDRFGGSTTAEIKRASGKRLTSMGSTAKGVAVSADHRYVMAVFSSASAVIFSADLSGLEATELEEYNANVKSMTLGADASAGKTVTVALSDGNGSMYVGLQDTSVQRLTAQTFSDYGSENYAADIVVRLAEYGSFAEINARSGELYLTNENGNTVYVVDTKNDRLDYSVKLRFKIKDFTVADGADALVCHWVDSVSDKRIVTVYDYSSLSLMNSATAWKIALYIVMALSICAAAVLLFTVFSAELGSLILEKLKWFGTNVWRSKWVYLIMLPSFLLLCIFSLYPSVASIINSFFDYELGKPKIFIGLENYRELFITNGGIFLEILRNTLLMVATYLFTTIVPPVFFAYLIMLLRNKMSVKVIRWFLYIPGLLPTIAGMLMWRYGIYGINPDGAINTIIVKLFGGTPIPFLGDSRYAIWSLLFIGFPWVGGFLLFYGALMNIPAEIYDACELDGCGLARRFFSIDLPFILGQIKYVSVGALIAGVKAVGRVMATTEGQLGTMTMMYKLYDYLNNNRYGMASAVAVVMVLLLAGISIARVKKMLKQETSYD